MRHLACINWHCSSAAFGFAASYFVSNTYWQLVPQRIISANVDRGSAAGINALRLLKVKHCGELASRLSSRLTFAYLCVVVRANLKVNMPLRIRVGVHRVFPLTQLYRKCWISIKNRGWPSQVILSCSLMELSKGWVSISYKDHQPIYQLKFKKVQKS